MSEEQQAKERQQKWRFDPAYPHTAYEIAGIGAAGHFTTKPGISQRTLIAAMCLQGMLANSTLTWEKCSAPIIAAEYTDQLLTHLENTFK